MHFADMVKEILKENREHLDELVMKPRLATNSIVNETFKWIDVLARRNERCTVATLKHPIEEESVRRRIHK